MKVKIKMRRVIFMPNKVQTKYVLALILLLVTHLSHSQVPSADSLKNIWENDNNNYSIRYKAINTFYKQNTYASPDSSFLISQYHYDLAAKQENLGEMALALNEKSYAHFIKGELDKSMAALQESLELLVKLGDPLRLATVYSNMGNIYGDMREFEKAVFCFTQTLKIFQKEGTKQGEARMLNNLGIIYFMLDSYELAQNHFDRAQNINQSISKDRNTGSYLYYSSSIAYERGSFRKSISIGEKAIAQLISVNNRVEMAESYYLLAKCYQKLNQPDSAMILVQKSLEIDQEIQNESKIIERLILQSDLIAQNKLNEGTKAAEAIIQRIDSTTKNELRANLYEVLYKCYKRQGKFDQSLQMHEKYVKFNELFQLEKDKLAIIESALRIEYNESLEEKEIANKLARLKLKKANTKKTNSILLSGALSIGIILIITLLILRKNRLRRNTLLKELDQLKESGEMNTVSNSNQFVLNREKLEATIDRNLNETDWSILNVLLDDPVLSNKEIAEKVFKSVDGVGSSLRRMYEYFEVKESKYKKISLLMEAAKRSK
jgi:tetratricopeptide (TPR) repeat protein